MGDPARHDGGRWRHILPPIAILLIGLLLRLYRLDAQSMWFDEAARQLEARAGVSYLLSGARQDTLPPLYHLLMSLWQTGGMGDFWLRIPSVASSILTTAVVIRFARDLCGRKTALIAGAIFAIAPYQIYHAQQANVYSLLALLGGLQLLLFWAALSRESRGAWLGYALAAVAGIYVHYFAAFITLSLHVFLLFNLRRYRSRWRALALADSLILLGFLPLVGYLLAKTGEVAAGFWLTRPSLAAPLTTLHLFTVSYSLPESIVPVAFLLTTLFLAFVLMDLYFDSRRVASTTPAVLLITLATFLPILLLMFISQFLPLYLERTLITTAPAYAVLLARGVAIARRRSPTPYVGGLVTILVLMSLYLYFADAEFAKPDYRGAAAYIAENATDGDVVMHTGNGSYIPFLFYTTAEDDFLLEGDPAPHHPPLLHEMAGGRTVSPSIISEYQRLWLVVALEHSIEWQEEQAAAFATQYDELNAREFGGVHVFLYWIDGDER